jgi:glycosyltransferase involved in cell wall biosynthesis/O-antigen/teichoic acid export membrane protein
VPLVSVVLIFHNDERFLEEAVQSVCGQRLADWELILVDDGSTDRSTQIARDLAAHDGRIRYVEHPRHENRGMSASRNLGVAHTTTPYIAFLDADDVWVPNKLAEQANLLDSMPDVALVCGAQLYWYSWDPEATYLDRTVLTGGIADRRLDPPEATLALRPLGRGDSVEVDLLVRRTAFDAVGGFEERFRGLFEDQAFVAKILLRYPIYISSRVWLRYRHHNASTIAQTTRKDYWRLKGVFLDWLEEDAGRLADSRVSAAVRRARRELPYRRLTAPVHDAARRLFDCLPPQLRSHVNELRWRFKGTQLRTFGKQVFWTTFARAISALLQLAVIVLLARSLIPSEFAFAATANAFLMVMVQLNGFGIVRQIDYRRSLDPRDPALRSLFTVKLRYAYLSGLVWALVCAALWMATRDARFLILVPAAVWLIIEQITRVWNSVAIIDGKSQQLIATFATGRLPVVMSLGAGFVYRFDGLSCWVAGMVVGAFISYAQGWFRQEEWARVLTPRLAGSHALRIVLDIPFWLSEVGDEIKTLDVPVVALVSSATAGIYALPARLVQPMNLITEAGGWVAFPRLVRRDEVSRTELCLFVAAGSIPVLAVAAASYFAAPLIPIFAGEDYRSSVPVLQILAGTALLAGPSILLRIFLQARSSTAQRDAGLIMLFGNLFLLPCVLAGALGNGAVGAAVGSLAGQALMLLVLFFRGLAECDVRVRTPSELREDFMTKEPESTI